MQVSRGASTLYFNASFFCNPLLLKNISNPRSRSTKWEINIVLITVLVLQEYPQGYILSFIYKLLRALSLSRMLLEFSLRPVYSTIVGKNFQICGVHILIKCIESRHFYSFTPPHQKFFPKFLSSSFN